MHEIVTLVGFDFPYGYATGFAVALGLLPEEQAQGALEKALWRETWELISSKIKDDARNRSNRWETAAELNQRVSAKAFPFWGCPVSKKEPFLTPRKLHPYPPNGLQEFRFTEKRAKGAQSAWKLCFPGSVGSQPVTGIPVVARLRADPKLAASSVVWPFETGLRRLVFRNI